AFVSPKTPACTSVQNGALLPGCTRSWRASAAARSESTCASDNGASNIIASSTSHESALARARVFIEHPRAIVDVELPRVLVTVPGRVRPRRRVVRDAIRVVTVETRSSLTAVLATARER